MLKKAQAAFAPLTAAKAVADEYVQTFQDMRRWWPVLIPFLLWRARKAYQQEFYDTLATPGKPVVARKIGGRPNRER